MFDKDITDVNTEETPSTSSTATSENVDDVKQDNTLPSTEATKVSPTDLARGFQDAVKKGFEAAQASVEGKAEETSNTEEKETTPEVKEVSEQKDTKGQQEEKKDTKGPVPYSRFTEVNEAKVKLEQTIKEQEEFVKAQKSIAQFCEQNNLSGDDFSYWLNVAAAIKNNPEEALKMLQPHVTQLQEFKGEVLSSELQQAVNDGEISLALAKKFAANENKAKFNQQQASLTREQQIQRENQRFQNEVTVSFQSWLNNKIASDPDFKPKSSEDAPDGLYELTMDKIGANWRSQKLNSAQDLITFAEQCSKMVMNSFKKVQPSRPSSKIVRTSTTTSNNGTSGVPKSFNEALTAGFKKAGVNFTVK